MSKMQSQLPKYRSHKVVWAIKIESMSLLENGGVRIFPTDPNFPPFEVSEGYCKKHNPQPEGYYVVYKDGYESWSPADAFESGYTPYRDESRINILRPGYRYELQNFEMDGHSGQTLQFIEKEKQDGTDVLKTIWNGTTNEAVLEMLIDRLNFQHNKFPSRESALAITKLEESLMWLEKRTSDRKKRGVEGKHIA